MKKTDCQETFSTSSPPMIGPAAIEMPDAPPQMPAASAVVASSSSSSD
jgi:hypothetical protein